MNQHLIFDELEGNGDSIRLKNKQKSKNLMRVASAFADDATLLKLQQAFISLSPQEMQEFKSFLTNRDYLNGNQRSAGQKILNFITQTVLSSDTQDDYLKSIVAEYNSNLDMIDQLKQETNVIVDGLVVSKKIHEIQEFSNRNCELFELVKHYADARSNNPL
jgi:ABC-type phosphate/phosphonate transport system substrate-binding protein